MGEYGASRGMKSSLDEVMEFRRLMFERSSALIQTKGMDYNRQQQGEGDTLFNLRMCEVMGIVPTAEQGILVRLSDKLMRLISLMKTIETQPAIKDESLEDTVADIHNYVDYALLIFRTRQKAAHDKTGI